MRQPEILLIDNFDSFTFNLVDDLRRRGCQVQVYRNDLALPRAQTILDQMRAPAIVLSPGPGRPEQAGCCLQLVRATQLPLLGVCLGHQVIIKAYGGLIEHASRVMQGKASRIQHGGQGLFEGLPQPLRVGRYHSLAASELGPHLQSLAHDKDGVCMALAHRERPVFGLQFHPESILTTDGGLLLDAFLQQARQHHAKHNAKISTDVSTNISTDSSSKERA